jgi:isopenicillin-N N-acyltransferase like protein
MTRSIAAGLLLYLSCVACWGLEIIKNESPIMDAPPVLVSETRNGRLEIAGSGEDAIHILHLWGTPYEMGFAHGELLKQQVPKYVNGVNEAMAREMKSDLSLLDKVWESVKPHVSDYFLEELRGISEGAGVDLQAVIRSNMVGEASEWHCSLFGAWGKATESTGHLLQLRALDYEVNAGIQNFPLVVVYHPNEGQGHAFANIGWAGVVGAVTGISSEQLAISEIGDDYDKANDSFDGIPFMFLLRDILQFDKSLDEATARIKNAKRTTSLMYAVGDGEMGQARSYQTSRTLCNVFEPANLEPLTETHPRISDIVYWGMSWNVPAYDKPLHDMLERNYGKLTGEVTVQEILPTVHTGSLQVAVYDLTSMMVWTANARAENEKGPLKAYERGYVKLDMNYLFSRKPSSSIKSAKNK